MTKIKSRPMKESGVGWIGLIPESWNIKPAKALFSNPSEPSVGDDVHLTPSQKHGVLPQTEYMEITGSRVVLNLAGADSMRHVEAGDYISHLRSFQGGLEYSTYSGKVSSAYTVLRPRAKINPGYFKHLFKSAMYVQGLQTTTDQLRDGQSIRYGQFALLELPYPSVEEQAAIAEFLERETAQIDALIDKQQQLIETLAERRKAVITRAVTRGLDPTIVTIPSGIVWLPSVPTHWKVIPMKHVVRLQSGETISGEDIEPEGPYPVFGGNGFRGYTSTFTHSGEYVLIGRQGALCGNVNLARGDFWASEHAIVAHPLMDFPLTWLGFLLESMNLGQYSMTAAQPGISADLVARLGLPLPPPEERQRISEYLDIETNQIDGLRNKATDMIALLKERRQALISAAVTGKIDVRGE